MQSQQAKQSLESSAFQSFQGENSDDDKIDLANGKAQNANQEQASQGSYVEVEKESELPAQFQTTSQFEIQQELRDYLDSFMILPFNKFCVDCKRERSTHFVVTLGVYVCEDCSNKLIFAAGGNSNCLIKRIFNEQWDNYHLKSVAYGGNEKFFHYLREYGAERKTLAENYNKDFLKYFRMMHLAKIEGDSHNFSNVKKPPKDIGGKISQTSTKVVKGAATGAVTGVKGVGKGGMFLLKKIKSGGVAVGKGAKFVGGKVATGSKAVVTNAPGSIKYAAKGVANKSVGAAKFVGSGVIGVTHGVKNKIQRKKDPNVWNAFYDIDHEILPDNVKTELNSESLIFIIDVARMSQSPNDAINALNQSVKIKIYDDYVSPEWHGGLNHMEENSEIFLTLIDGIVTDHTDEIDNQIRSISVQRGVLHDKKVSYNSKSLMASVTKILTQLGIEDVPKFMVILQTMVKDNAKAIKGNYSELDNSNNIHAYCLVIFLYLGHFENKPVQNNNDKDKQNNVILGEIDTDQRVSHLLAYLQQTQCFQKPKVKEQPEIREGEEKEQQQQKEQEEKAENDQNIQQDNDKVEEQKQIANDQVNERPEELLSALNQSNYPDEFKNVLFECQAELKEVAWWMERALKAAYRYKGQCTRKVKVNNQNEKDYYQMGKIFRFQNIVSATVGDESQETQQDSEVNVYFHIYSINGRCVKQFIGSESGIEATCANTILFPSGSEFLVCKRTDDAISGITHIYLREIQLGFAKNMVFWLSDDLEGDQLALFQKAQRKAEHDDVNGLDLQYVFKTNSNVARAYMYSSIFKVSMHVCDSFKVMQNLERLNENDINVDNQPLIIEKQAAIKFDLDFKNKVDKLSPDSQQKVSVAIYKSNEQDNIQEAIDEFIMDENMSADVLDYFQSIKTFNTHLEAFKYSRLPRTDKNYYPARGFQPQPDSQDFAEVAELQQEQEAAADEGNKGSDQNNLQGDGSDVAL